MTFCILFTLLTLKIVSPIHPPSLLVAESFITYPFYHSVDFCSRGCKWCLSFLFNNSPGQRDNSLSSPLENVPFQDDMPIWTVGGLWEEAAVPLKPQTELAYPSFELATFLLRLRPTARAPYRSDGRLPQCLLRCYHPGHRGAAVKTRPQVLAGGVVSLRHRYLKCSVLKSSQGPGSQYITRERQR